MLPHQPMGQALGHQPPGQQQLQLPGQPLMHQAPGQQWPAQMAPRAPLQGTVVTSHICAKTAIPPPQGQLPCEKLGGDLGLKSCPAPEIVLSTCWIPSLLLCPLPRPDADERWSPGTCIPARPAAGSSPKRHGRGHPHGPHLTVENLAPESPRTETVSALRRGTSMSGDHPACFSCVISPPRFVNKLLLFSCTLHLGLSQERHLPAVIMLSRSAFPCACPCPSGLNSGLRGTCQRWGKEIGVLTPACPKFPGWPPRCSFTGRSGCHSPNLSPT